MRYPKDSLDFQLNLCALEEMERLVPMTSLERSRVRGWAKSGHGLESNPWNYRDGEGFPLNYLQAFRLRYGYSSGPWDFWRGPETEPLWDDEKQCYRRPGDG